MSDAVLRIYAKGNAKPLHHVRVTLQKQKFESDSDGRLNLSIPQDGDGFVRFVLGGYEPLEVAYSDLRPSGEFDIFLLPSLEGENVIVVTGKKREVQVSRKSVSIQEAAKVAPNADPAQVIKLLPGVQSRPYRAEAIIRGSGPRDSRYFIDDLEVPFLFHSIGDLSVIPGAMMKDVKFDSGGFGADQGDATGGIIVVQTQTQIPEAPKTEFVLNLPFYSGIFHSRPLSQNSGLSVGVRRSYVDIILRKILNERNKSSAKEEGSLTLVPYFADAQVVYWERNEDSYTKLSLLGAYDGLKAGFPSDSFTNLQGQASLEFLTSFVNLGLEHSNKLSQGWRIKTTPQVYYFNTSADIFGQTITTKNWVTRIPTQWTKRWNSEQSMNVGLDPAFHFVSVHYNAIIFDASDPTFDPEDAPIRQASFLSRYAKLAAWINFDQKLGAWTLSPGLRVFHDGSIRKISADPRLRTQYALNNENILKAAVGQYSNAPSGAKSSPEIGNPQLGFERAYHYVLGWERHWSEEWQTDLQVYDKHIFNVVASDSLTRYNNKGSLKSYGVEAFIRRNLTERLFAWLSYTYSRTLSRDSAQDAYVPAEYDQTHNLYLVANYRISTRWELGGRFNTHTGDTDTPVAYGVYNASLDKYQPRISAGSESSTRLATYNSLSLYAGHDWLFNAWKLNLRFGLESYWPKPQVLGTTYNYDYSKSEQQKGLSNIPFLELRGEF